MLLSRIYKIISENVNNVSATIKGMSSGNIVFQSLVLTIVEEIPTYLKL